MGRRTLLVLVMAVVMCGVSSGLEIPRYTAIDIGMLRLESLGEFYAFGTCINNSGQVAGLSRNNDGHQRPFLWTMGATDGVPSNPEMKDTC